VTAPELLDVVHPSRGHGEGGLGIAGAVGRQPLEFAPEIAVAASGRQHGVQVRGRRLGRPSLFFGEGVLQPGGEGLHLVGAKRQARRHGVAASGQQQARSNAA
jgi:hypothetical protein